MAGPPRSPLGERLTLKLDVQIRDARHRETEHVSDTVARWVVRYVRRHWPEYEVEGSSTQIRPGQTYRDWWFGDVEVYVFNRSS